ncbi:YlbE-like family protein [Bacillus atrophaeus]|uniref:YlbE-like family protein n=1 Tax=Bacillus atrophaeus TaxID=1452 RepID=UPI00227FAE48|nr:YlbE-like family protein [Bacillus atrophaeus]MCY8917097.1 YlbE-like family protein [Bacillus atrophaeus]MCY8925272.1 YlbE-like family protein [Bacillus atrophaeus]
MRKDVQEFIMADEERRRFIREQPIWYRRLARNPDELAALQLAMMNYYEKTIPHRVHQFTNGIQMAQMMVQMFQAMRTQD